MSLLLAAIAYIVYTAFCLRLLWHFFFWVKALRPGTGIYHKKNSTTFGTAMLMAFDVIFFRRVLVASGLLWFGSLIFHLSFLLVALGHLRYFTDPVPSWIQDLQTCGMLAGYMLPASVIYLLTIRIFSKKDRYLNYENYLVLGLVLLISITGLFMRLIFRPDLTGIKEFSFGLLTFQPAPLQNGYLFVIHLLIVLLLIILLPSHIFSAPLVTMEARRRESALDMVMHEK
jgi:nitrate reductase gamma subunit